MPTTFADRIAPTTSTRNTTPRPHMTAAVLPRPRRTAPALAALATTLVLMGTVLGGFDQAGPQRWIADTPAVRAALAHCPAPAARQAHNACREAVAARHAPRPDGGAQVTTVASR